MTSGIDSTKVGNDDSSCNNGLIYNDELLEELSGIILLGSKPGAAYTAALPGFKKILNDYDIYAVSFMSDADIEKLAKEVAEKGLNGSKITDKKLKEKLLAIRDNARTFIRIADQHCSVRGYIDRTLTAEGREEGMIKLTGELTDSGSDYKLKQVGATACKKFLCKF